MPDLTIEVYYHCQSAESFTIQVVGQHGTYTVSYGAMQHGPYEYDYTCTCQAFKFGKGKPCKHIKDVQKLGQHCNWLQQTDGGEPIEKNGQKCCPNCGLPAHARRYGV